MRVEGRLAAELLEASEWAGRSSSKKTERRPRRRHRKSSTMPKMVQRLYDTCKDVFSGGGAGVVPSRADIERIVAVLGDIRPVNVGLAPNMPYFKNVGNTERPPVTYLHIYACDKFSIGIFCLPPSAVIPLHNHPGMTVFSKLLFGSMHIKSYDWVDSSQLADGALRHWPPGMRLAKVKTDSTFTAPCDISILYPTTGGNLHRFTALTSCAVLDVLGPPYSDGEGRPCTYYNDFPYEDFSGFTCQISGMFQVTRLRRWATMGSMHGYKRGNMSMTSPWSEQDIRVLELSKGELFSWVVSRGGGFNPAVCNGDFKGVVSIHEKGCGARRWWTKAMVDVRDLGGFIAPLDRSPIPFFPLGFEA